MVGWRGTNVARSGGELDDPVNADRLTFFRTITNLANTVRGSVCPRPAIVVDQVRPKSAKIRQRLVWPWGYIYHPSMPSNNTSKCSEV